MFNAVDVFFVFQKMLKLFFRLHKLLRKLLNVKKKQFFGCFGFNIKRFKSGQFRSYLRLVFNDRGKNVAVYHFKHCGRFYANGFGIHIKLYVAS